MGGIAKGQIVREIDAMGGYSGIVSDLSTIQFRMLNKSKGPAMWSPRAQNDRHLFASKWREMLELTPNVDFGTAKTLTQVLRGRNIATKGMGVPGVEALTLPYIRDAHHGGDVYEVACNLLEPKLGSVDKIELELEKWIQKQKQQLLQDDEDVNDQYNRDCFIEKAYRVGTTEEQCQTVLKDAIDDDEYWMQYDEQVCRRFKEFLGHR